MVQNTGISLGLPVPGLVVVSGVLLVVLGWWIGKERNWRLGLIFLGGLGNWLERLIFGYVRDYWKIPGTNIYNNVYDWLIFLGLGLYLWQKRKKLR